jgi:hypothetical protein
MVVHPCSPDRPAALAPNVHHEGGATVDHSCIVIPILPGKTDAARAFQREVDTTRKADYARTERRLGVTREYWFIAELPGGDQFVLYWDSADANQVVSDFVQSQDPFDLWFKDQVREVTGLDLNNPPADMKLPELVSTYEA